MPLPESEEVFNTNKWELKRSILVQEETSRKLSNNILIPETFKSWRNRINRINATWRSYNRQLNSLCMNLMATVKDPVLATSNRFHLLKCKQNKSISNVWQNSYTQFLRKPAPPLIGSLQIKECHIKNLGPIMDYLINDITKNISKDERLNILKQWTARLKFTIEVSRKDNTSLTIPSERDNKRWVDAQNFILNEVYEGTAVPEAFLEKQKKYNENVLSTNDAVEWSLNEDAIECIRSQHFEIFVPIFAET